MEKEMRADARRHREKLVEAAALVFARDGLDAPLETVLQEANLGRGTLYRHFPDREALFASIVDVKLDEMAAFVSTIRGSPNLLQDYLVRQSQFVGRIQAAIHRLDPKRIAAYLPPLMEKAKAISDCVIDNARNYGQVTSDFDATDLRLVAQMLAVAGTSGIEPSEVAVDKALQIILKGLRPEK